MRSARIFGGIFVSTLPFVFLLNLLEQDLSGFIDTWLLSPLAVIWLAPAAGVVYRVFQATRLRSKIDASLGSAGDTTPADHDAGAA